MMLGVKLELVLKSSVGYNQTVEELGALVDLLECICGLLTDSEMSWTWAMCLMHVYKDWCHLFLWYSISTLYCGMVGVYQREKHFNAVKQTTTTDAFWTYGLHFVVWYHRLCLCNITLAKYTVYYKTSMWRPVRKCYLNPLQLLNYLIFVN